MWRQDAAVSSCEAVVSCQAPIQQTNARLNTLVEVPPDEALDMANTTDWAVALCSKEDNLWT
jgi:hypothetical protein